MTHNEKRGHWVREGAISLGTGILYGVTVVGAAHPYDTVKTKMQAQVGFENSSMINTFIRVYKAEGIKGLYRGCVPPLWGSGIYRSVQFSAFEATYTFLDKSHMADYTIPYTNGLQLRVILSGIMAGTARSIVETPLEFAKIHRQMNQNWHLKDCYTGMGITWARASILLPMYFIAFDSFRRNFDDTFRNTIYGPFFASGISSVIAWWTCWPLELLKTHIQSGPLNKKMTWSERLRFIYKERGGIKGFYRGILPGSLRSFFGNGWGMVVMQYAQKKVTEYGWRNDDYD